MTQSGSRPSSRAAAIARFSTLSSVSGLRSTRGEAPPTARKQAPQHAHTPPPPSARSLSCPPLEGGGSGRAGSGSVELPKLALESRRSRGGFVGNLNTTSARSDASSLFSPLKTSSRAPSTLRSIAELPDTATSHRRVPIPSDTSRTQQQQPTQPPLSPSRLAAQPRSPGTASEMSTARILETLGVHSLEAAEAACHMEHARQMLDAENKEAEEVYKKEMDETRVKAEETIARLKEEMRDAQQKSQLAAHTIEEIQGFLYDRRCRHPPATIFPMDIELNDPRLRRPKKPCSQFAVVQTPPPYDSRPGYGVRIEGYSPPLWDMNCKQSWVTNKQVADSTVEHARAARRKRELRKALRSTDVTLPNACTNNEVQMFANIHTFKR